MQTENHQRLLVALFLSFSISAVEVGPLQVVRVVDGDTIIVKAPEAGAEDLRVRLLWIDTPESKGNSHGAAMPEGAAASAFLTEKIPASSLVTLWGPGEALELDVYKRTLAIVIPTKAVVIQENGTARRGYVADEQCAQELMIANGWTPYWRKYGEAPEPWHARFLEAQKAAEDGKVGAWGTAEKWMRDKSNETTAKRK